MRWGRRAEERCLTLERRSVGEEFRSNVFYQIYLFWAETFPVSCAPNASKALTFDATWDTWFQMSCHRNSTTLSGDLVRYWSWGIVSVSQEIVTLSFPDLQNMLFGDLIWSTHTRLGHRKMELVVLEPMELEMILVLFPVLGIIY